jgi:hypothetical protein
MCPKEIGRKGVGWIHLVPNGDKEPVLVKRVMDLPVPSNVGIS